MGNLSKENVERYVSMESEIKSLLRDKGASEYIADEIYQEAFIKIYSGNVAYKEEGKFRGWIMFLVKNMLIDTFRKKNRSKELPLFTFTDHVGKSFTVLDFKDFNNEMNVEERLIRDELVNDAILSYNRLPKNLKEATRLRVFCDMSFNEIAEEMNTSVSTSLGRIRYSKIRLRKEINW